MTSSMCCYYCFDDVTSDLFMLTMRNKSGKWKMENAKQGAGVMALPVASCTIGIGRRRNCTTTKPRTICDITNDSAM